MWTLFLYFQTMFKKKRKHRSRKNKSAVPKTICGFRPEQFEKFVNSVQMRTLDIKILKI